MHLITDRTGLPLSVGISGANLHDSQALNPLVKGIPPIRSRRGQTGKAPRRQGIRLRPPAAMVTRTRHQAAHRPQGIEPSSRLGRHRWTVERTTSWLAGCRPLVPLFTCFARRPLPCPWLSTGIRRAVNGATARHLPRAAVPPACDPREGLGLCRSEWQPCWVNHLYPGPFLMTLGSLAAAAATCNRS
ncbi:hypothetical protein [Streptomyces rochei]|uniref:hypothetical protein n=1 Tax=Streptomyces rochei TaxID=1928 RepID=UPI003D8DCE14